MLQHSTQIRVKYADTDKAGVVYYANYAVFYEAARTELFRSIGFPYSKLEQEQDIVMPVVELISHYHRSAKYDDLLTVEATVEQMPTAKIVFKYRILAEDGTLLNDGQTTLVFVSTKTGRPMRAPENVKEALAKYFE